MSIFGWSYPPGVTGNEPEIVGYEGPCDVCGRSVDDCICPECPECGSCGDPVCYDAHGLIRTDEQVESRAQYDRQQAEEAANQVAYYAAEDAALTGADGLDWENMQ